MDASPSNPVEKELSPADNIILPPPLPSILPIKTCPKCEDIVRNVSSPSNIHLTLAYSRCRCHRSWRYSMPHAASVNRCVSAALTNRRSYPSPSPLLKGQGDILKPVLGHPPSLSKNGLVKRYFIQQPSAKGSRRTPFLPPLNKTMKTELAPCPPQQANVYTEGLPIYEDHKMTKDTLPSYPLSSSAKQVTFADQLYSPKAAANSARIFTSQKPSTPAVISNSIQQGHPTSLPASSSIPSLPQIQNFNSNSLLMQPLIERKTPPHYITTSCDTCDSVSSGSSTVDGEGDREEEKSKKSLLHQPSVMNTTCVSNETIIKNFEFVSLVKYVPPKHKIIASDLFDCLDQNGDGHLSFSEVLAGLTSTWQNVSAVLKLEHYLKPLYHVLGDDTYFSKRDFVLCYELTQLFKEYNTSIPYLANVDKQFYLTAVKPLLMTLISSCSKVDSSLLNDRGDEDTYLSLQTIEAAVKKLNVKIQLSFNSKTANKLKKHSNGFTILEILLFAPYIFTIHK